MRLCIEAVGGARVDKLYTLLDCKELAPRSSYEVAIGDLHSGDICHVPVLVWLPALPDDFLQDFKDADKQSSFVPIDKEKAMRAATVRARMSNGQTVRGPLCERAKARTLGLRRP